MTSEIKFIVGELNKPPYSRNYNLITFDSLTPEQLLQVLNDVFTEIDGKNSMDIREEEPDQMAVRFLNMLRILKYKPPEEYKNNFRSGLVAGQKHIIHSILAWLLEGMEEMKKRSYLAKYLVRIDIPQEIMGDADVADAFAKSEEMIDIFKSVHKEFESLKSSGFSTAELRKDIATMEEERDLVSRRIERMKQKTDGIPNQASMLEAATLLRKEKERQKTTQQQESDLKVGMQFTESRIGRLEVHLKDLRKASMGTTPEGLVQRLEQDVNVNNYIVNEKMPKELEAKHKLVAILQKVAAQPAMGQEELDGIKRKISSVNSEINELNETRMREVEEDESSEGKVGKLSFFRQNAAIISRKKDQVVEKLRETRVELATATEELEEKKEQLKEYSGEEILRGDDFKLYINKLRGKSSTYKMKRAELSELRAEFGILSRTEEILKAQDAQIDEQLSNMEQESGVPGFRSTQETLEKVSSTKAEVDERKGETLEQMSDMVRELNFKVAERKAVLAPLLKEVRPLRDQMANFTAQYNEKKSAFDSMSAGLESNVAKLEQDVKGLQEEILKAETKWYADLANKDLLNYKKQQASEEIRLYLSKDAQDKKKSLRDQLMNLIADQEKQGWMLREEQKTVKDLVQNSARQLTMWQDVIRLLEAKQECLNTSRGNGRVTRSGAAEALVL